MAIQPWSGEEDAVSVSVTLTSDTFINTHSHDYLLFSFVYIYVKKNRSHACYMSCLSYSPCFIIFLTFPKKTNNEALQYEIFSSLVISSLKSTYSSEHCFVQHSRNLPLFPLSPIFNIYLYICLANYI